MQFGIFSLPYEDYIIHNINYEYTNLICKTNLNWLSL